MSMGVLSNPMIQATPLPNQDRVGEVMSAGMAMVASLIASVEPRGGENQRTVERYLQLMRRDDTYFENMAIAAFCTRFKGRVEVTLVDHRGAEMQADDAGEHRTINPLDGSQPEWAAKLICVDDEHFALLIRLAGGVDLLTPRRPPELEDRLLQQAKIDSLVLARGEEFAASQGTTQRELLRKYSEAMEEQRAARQEEEEEPLAFARQLEAAVQNSIDTAEEHEAELSRADQLEATIENSLATAAVEERDRQERRQQRQQEITLPTAEGDLYLEDDE
eukprot:6859796-Prymnesium_polylepis.1